VKHRIPATTVQLGHVLDLTTQDGEIRTAWEAGDVGGMVLVCDARAMQRRAGAAALYLLRPREGNPERKLRADRVRLDRGGYAYGGRQYFGVGAPVYRVYDDAGDVDLYVRAPSARAAKEHVRKLPAHSLQPLTRNPAASMAADTYAKWHEREPECVTELDGLPDALPVCVGDALRIGYRSDKWHERGQVEDYDHDYTERGYRAPQVWADCADLSKAKAICIVGGNQRITPKGID
jgi:hypothetical protein